MHKGVSANEDISLAEKKAAIALHSEKLDGPD
jgi:hypothetical protein